MAPTNLGELEQLVLLAIARLGDDAYGVTIRREIATRTKRDLAFGSVYTTLARLEEKGLVASHLGDATPERGGRAKKHFVISASRAPRHCSAACARSVRWPAASTPVGRRREGAAFFATGGSRLAAIPIVAAAGSRRVPRRSRRILPR